MVVGLSVGNVAFATTIEHSDISHNRLAASATAGSVLLQGAGIGHLNGAPLVLHDTTVARNVATGNGPGEWIRAVASGTEAWTHPVPSGRFA
jgi:hypothetical protein